MTNNVTNRILLIEDDASVRELLCEYLEQDGFGVTAADDGGRGLELTLSDTAIDLIILDLMLPTIDGLEILRQLRHESSVPVLILTARRDDVDRIVGLELGADDYLPKPFNPRELVARVRAILRRAKGTVPANNSITEFGPLVLNTNKREVRVDGLLVNLTPTEFRILDILLQNTDKVVTKNQLSLDALGKILESYDRSLDVHVSHVRQKLTNPAFRIKTVRSVGYLLEMV